MSGYSEVLGRRPGKIICVGMNYPPISGDDFQTQNFPILFQKPTSSLAGNGDMIIVPEVSNRVLYEGELAVVIGRAARNIPKERALSYVEGFTIANDISAADIEARTSQWASGKMFDTFTPIGPLIIAPDEFDQPLCLGIETRLNGGLVQTGNTSEMIFGLRELISYISRLTTLVPGDVILTGSPKQCNGKPDPRISLKDGDQIEVKVEGIGKLINPVIDEKGQYE